MMRKRAKPGCCRGCDTPWRATHAEGKCRTCHACLECCGKIVVPNSCKHRSDIRTSAQHARSAAAYDGYWRSVEAGRQRR